MSIRFARGRHERESSRRASGQAAVILLVIVVVLIGGGIAAWLWLRDSATTHQPRPRSVLLVVADTLRADHMGCYGFKLPTSPRLDELAGEGMLFSDFNTVIPATLPSFSSLLTSRQPKDHGAGRNGFPLDDGHARLSEAFRDAGFETAAFVASYCVSAEFGIAEGFEHFDEEFTIDTGLPHNKLIRKADKISDAVIAWLRERDADRPFFAMVHYFDPHWPYDQPEPFRTTFCPAAAGDRTLGSIQNVLDARDYLTKGGAPDRRCHDLHGLYCGSIAFMDQQIGRVLDAVEELGVVEETLVVFTADHAETFWEHGDYFDHGLYVYDTNVRIPLIVRWPGGVAGDVTVETPLCTLDLAPTLLEMCGLEVPPVFEGLSFGDVLRGGGDVAALDRAVAAGGGEGEDHGRQRLLFAEACKPYDVEEGAPRLNFNKAKSVRKGQWKLVSVPFMQNRRELYDLNADPAETTNLIRNPAYRPVVTALSGELERWAATFSAGGPTGEMDEEARKKLEALGY